MSFAGRRNQQSGNTLADGGNQGNNQGNQGNNQNNNNQGNNNNQNNQGNNNDKSASDAGNDDAFLDKLWSDVQQDSKIKDNADDKNAPAPVVKTPEEQIKAYLESVGLQPIQFADKDIEEMKAGNYDFKAFVDKVNNNVTQAHLQSLSSAKKMIDNAVTQAVEKAVGDSKSYFAGERFRETMYEKLPFTEDKMIGPVAETIAQRLMARGATQEQAFKGIEKWFDTAFKKINPELGDLELNSNTRDTYRGNPRSQRSGNVDWLDMLQGKPRQ